jgi:hypothetical protein
MKTYSGEESLDMKLCGPQSQSECCVKEKYLLSLPGIEARFLSCTDWDIRLIPFCVGYI